MAAAIALMLYTQMPRVAFESERDKEQLLIDRGEQYKRAILLYYNDYKRFPGKIEDLESTNNHRYLRRRYVDPYTGKDEWRLVHTNGMFLTDSLVQKPPANPANSPTGSSQAQTATAGLPAGFGSTPGGTLAGAQPSPSATASPTTTNPPNTPPQVNAAVLARPSDRPLTPAGGFQGAFQTAANTLNNAPSNTGYVDPASYPPITLFPNGYNAPPTGAQPGAAGVAAQPGIVQPGGFQPGGFQPGIPPGISQPGIIQQPGIAPNGQFQPGPPGQFVPPGAAPANPNAAFQNPTGINPGQPFPVTQPLPINTQPFPTNSLPTPISQGFLPGVPQPSIPGAPTGYNPVTAPPQPVNTPVDPNNGFNNGNPPNPVQNPGFNPGQPGFGQPGQNQPGFPGVPSFPAQQASAGAAPPANQALNLINQLLTTPRQPPPGIGPATATTANNNQTIGGGIAGVASTFTGPTIKTYLDHSQYQEWEFIFQVQQQGLPGQAGAAANPLGAPGANGNSPTGPGTIGPGTGGIGQPGIGSTGIGQPGIGQPGGFGQPGIGPGANGQPNIGPTNGVPGLPPLQ
jgi:hypothetical protein